MEKNRQTVRVVDEHGAVIGYTYPKRAKGLVKKSRAEFVTDLEIRLCKSSPIYKSMEDEEMDECKKINYLTINPTDWFPDVNDPNTQDSSKNSTIWDRFIIDNPLKGAIPSAPGMVEILTVGSFNWNLLSRIAYVPFQLAPNTEYQFTFWLNGGENDRSDEICNLEILYLSEDKTQYTNRFCYRLNRSYIKPLKKYKGWEYYVLPFTTDNTGFVKLRLVADRAPMAVMAAQLPEAYAELEDVLDLFEGKRPQRHNIVFEDGWPTDKWYATKALAGTKLTTTIKNQLLQNDESGLEKLSDRMDDLEETVEVLDEHIEDMNEQMSDLSEHIIGLTNRLQELTEVLGTK
ncbi:MAG: hypothetical protein IJN16_02330 [Lachnospiraceae bacterium]|nr:hypothetical protein [Lachnospiraceae bacterium]